MRSASINQFNQLDFVFLDLRKHALNLNKEEQKYLNQIENLVIKVFSSKTGLKNAI